MVEAPASTTGFAAAPPAPPQIVIVGAGFGGLSVAKGLARADVEITIVDRRNHHLFQPLLYQVATAGLSPRRSAASCAGRRMSACCWAR